MVSALAGILALMMTAFLIYGYRKRCDCGEHRLGWTYRIWERDEGTDLEYAHSYDRCSTEGQ